ncbi:short chain dehydrogenase [Rhexocercosporidium sp. MPI-PUGE-AT-0058]|nr:short chain dehydrogenase [Rhexocercosporidium sp. MPI-PUGE-AT-0058]
MCPCYCYLFLGFCKFSLLHVRFFGFASLTNCRSKMSTKTIVLVTGGNNGIGFAACQLLASQPNYHCIMASRSLEKGKKAIESIQSSNPSHSVSLVQLDITSDASITAAVEEVKTKHGHLDVLINNAGICPVDFSRSVLRDCLETNAISPAMVTDAFAPLLLKASSPRIIYVSSALGSIQKRGDPKDLAYSEAYKAYRISKAALNMIVACDAWEYRERAKVFAFCPGYVITDLAGLREAKEKAGVAKSPDGSARGLLAIAEGKRDEENGLFLHDEGVGKLYPW